MFFCPNCNNVFDITKGTAQHGGDCHETEITNNINFDESKHIHQHIGGNKDDNYEKLISKLLKNEKINDNEINNVFMDDLIKSSPYKKLKNKQREQIYNKIQDLLPTEKKKLIKDEAGKQIIEKAYFICNNCGYRKPIEEGTLIFSKVSNDIAQSYSSSDVKDMKHSDILPRTSKYICPNSKCESHTNSDKKEAVFFRMNNTFKIKHICQTCDAIF